MANSLPWGKRAPLLLALPVFVLPLLLAEQRPSAPVAQSRIHVNQGSFQDWSTRHALYPRFGTMGALEAARRDPRALSRWREMDRQSQGAQLQLRQQQIRSFLLFGFPPRIGPGRFPARRSADLKRDWSISLGSGTTAAGQFPAKYIFDTTTTVTTANCATDFAVFPVNANGNSTQPNIVAFNNLYSGTGPNGICNRNAQPNDDDVSATVMWSYDIEALANGTVATSPVLSLDGKKVAFVESGGGNPAHFHVLAWRSGDGQATNRQNALVPKTLAAPFSTTAPVASGTSGAVTDLPFGASTDTLSSPYVDYAADTAYVGNDAGVLFRIKNVFCTTTSCGNAAPSLDTTWGGTGSVNVCSGKLTGPVQDVTTNNIFVGCADGKVYGFNSTGSALAIPSIAVGDGTANGGVVETPIVDGSGFLFAVSGTGAGTNNNHAVIVQARTSLAGPCAGGALCVATVGNPNVHPAHAPALNDAYFTNPTATTWLLYMGGFTGGTSGTLSVYGATFNASRVMTAGTPTNRDDIGTRPGEYSPFTEFKNGATDLLFLGVTVNMTDMTVIPINTFPSGIPATTAAEGIGISGMIVDNSSGSAQASSIYFATLSTNTAVKLTQTGLQ